MPKRPSFTRRKRRSTESAPARAVGRSFAKIAKQKDEKRRPAGGPTRVPIARKKPVTEAFENGEGEEDELANYEFASLKLRKRSIKSTTVMHEWHLASAASQTKIADILTSLRRQALTGIHTRPDGLTGPHLALMSLNDGLKKRLPRMPFPPGTKDWHFDFDAILHAQGIAETNLTSVEHAVLLLDRAITNESNELAAEETRLHQLQKNSNSEAVMRSRRKLKHSALLGLHNMVAHNADTETASFKPPRAGYSLQDTELAQALSSLVEQLSYHAQSIESNTGRFRHFEGEVWAAAGAALNKDLPD